MNYFLNRFLFIVLFCCSYIFCFSQNVHLIDSLSHRLDQIHQDTDRVLTLAVLSYELRNTSPDTSMLYGQAALRLAQKIHFKRGEARALHTIASTFRIMGEISNSMESVLNALNIARGGHYSSETSRCLNLLGIINQELKNYNKALDYLHQALAIAKIDTDLDYDIYKHILELSNLGVLYKLDGYPGKNLDSAKYYLEQAYIKSISSSEYNPSLLSHMGDLNFKLGNPALAFEFSNKAIELGLQNNDHRVVSYCANTRAGFHKTLGQTDSAIYYATLGLEQGESIKMKDGILMNSNMLAELYSSSDLKKALYYTQKAFTINNELYGPDKMQSLQNTIANDQEHYRQLEAARIAKENKIKQYSLVSGLAVFALIAFILYTNNRQKHKANIVLENQKMEIQYTLSQLKSAQAQLIHSEKMASLGELTAGIAHEIQNPLNFVNNFSEVNTELIKELEEASSSEQRDASNEADILTNIKENSEKINHHGKRADAIVKNMLQHSRGNESGNKKEPSDINALADEYFRLAYHGLKAKDKEFNSKMELNFDPSIGNINVIPQEIGRVLLNLINNAFYAVNEKKKLNGETYDPVVSVSTKKVGDKIEIRVKDNGNGISYKIKDKIFQPFFTTKPTGQGTGLGLSLSYDIVKAHGGELKVETLSAEAAAQAGKKDTGSEFIIQLPSKLI